MSEVDFNISSELSKEYEEKYSAHNYHPLPVVFHRALGSKVWDPEGKEYLDFLSAYSAINQGHCHPRIIKALVDQSKKLTLSSRAFSNDVFSNYSKFITEYFGYEMVLPMNTGAEAVETGLKLIRRWGYFKKGIAENKAIILGASNNFHGRSIGIISLSSDEDARKGFGPFVEGISCFVPGSEEKRYIRYGEIEDLRESLRVAGDKVAGILLEPIQGEAGIVVPPEGYFREVRKLCDEHNVLLVVDEIQTGIGRTGRMLCYEHYGIRPDVVLLGKALGGGVLPISAVLSSREIMLCFEPGSHGSTFGGNPLASRVGIEALRVVREEKLVERAAALGAMFKKKLCQIQEKHRGIVSEVRGMGLLLAIVIDPRGLGGRTAWDVCLKMKELGVLAKPTHGHIIRLAPPLVISQEDLLRGAAAIDRALGELARA
ncbi:ornithine-oxo-acid transaminase [Ascoidea rubescens DSM 1968]|uniref:Ornithine aminotransferase n=1 Tax=Ascoidea rubescens DSM 1968 TaxID=1344418 RepID=A0A1D2VPF1_9ASCO|nr:ornithine aminotransferase [Ascoidea rubescens DSM 1968]ODV63464.1 ornithine aminotransferase [Ascoidea rubescens DSM 1968]